MKKHIIKIFILLFIANISYSQVKKQFTNSGTVNEQFENLIKNSNKYQDYKVVKLNWLLKLKNNVQDSLDASKKEIFNSSKLINAQLKKIDSLNVELVNSETSIRELKTKIESISLFGIQIEKRLFKTIIFSIIGALVLFLVLFISKFNKSNIVTKQTKSDLKELEEEYDEHRKKALEREQKVMRRLQDELNKQKKD